ncbi:MAG: hypothetical protein OES57_06730 [Acidimicrobiia bacterium]|nr:hypothetical protein [Acidimicrobiia bacterium]
MTRLLRLVALVGLVAAACSSTQLPDIDTAPTTTDASSPTTTAPDPSTPAPDSESPPFDPIELPGRLAALGPTGELLVRSTTGEWAQWSSSEALVSQFSWAPDGTQLVWTELTADGTTRVRVGDGTTAEDLEIDRPPFFLWWSEAPQLSHLGSADDLVTLERTPLAGQSDELARAAPLFYTVSDQGRIVTHEGADELNLLIDSGPEPLARAAAGFQAPAWIDDERVLALVALEQADALAIVNVSDGTIEPLFEVDGNISFVVSPDGQRVAYQIIESAAADDRPVRQTPIQTDEPGEDNLPDVLILDLDSRAAALAFVGQALWLEWSPDSASLAGLIATADLTWRIWDEAEIVRTDPVQISRVMSEQFVPFYDQYAQSQTGWSPDSDHYAFAAELDGRNGVFVQEAMVGGQAVPVGEGVMVAWSPTG